MVRPRLIRDLRIAWRVAFGILCVLLVALWVRSRSHWDFVGKETRQYVAVASSKSGILQLQYSRVQRNAFVNFEGWFEEHFPSDNRDLLPFNGVGILHPTRVYHDPPFNTHLVH